MSGIDLFTELRRIHPDLRILLMSGYNLHGARADGLLASGAAGFLQKPFRSDDLAAAVARSLAAG
jgi:DNA-binding NarL/FixJ family response regulator